MNAKARPRVRDLRVLGIRVSEEAALVFDLARVAYAHRSMQELLRPVLEAEAERLASVPEVRAMLESARELRRQS